MLKIEDDKVTGVMFRGDTGWLLRMEAPTMTEDLKEHPYLWYVMTDHGWLTMASTEDVECERQYQEILANKASQA